MYFLALLSWDKRSESIYCVLGTVLCALCVSSNPHNSRDFISNSEKDRRPRQGPALLTPRRWGQHRVFRGSDSSFSLDPQQRPSGHISPAPSGHPSSTKLIATTPCSGTEFETSRNMLTSMAWAGITVPTQQMKRLSWGQVKDIRRSSRKSMEDTCSELRFLTSQAS